MADSYPHCTRAVLRLPASVRLWLSELAGEPVQHLIGKNRGKRGSPDHEFNNRSTELKIHRDRCCMERARPDSWREGNEPQTRIRGASASTDVCRDRAG